MWTIIEDTFNPASQHHKETIFTIGNGYLSTRGAFEEGYPGEHRATFLHGVFDDAPIVFTELANAPDWLAFSIWIDGERFTLTQGTIETYSRRLDLKCGLLSRSILWASPGGKRAEITFERFVSLAHEHLVFQRVRILPFFDGTVEVRGSLQGCVDNEGLTHWQRIDQGTRDDVTYLRMHTRSTRIELVEAMRFLEWEGEAQIWDADYSPTRRFFTAAREGQALTWVKAAAIYTSRDTSHPLDSALDDARKAQGWEAALEENRKAWQNEWDQCDILIEGDDESQLAVRFSIYHLLIAAPRNDDRVNIGAKTLSGFGYRGHSFWDTEVFILPLFTFTRPEIARNLLNYRFQRLERARAKARANGFEGAQFPWESADTGDEVTPTWVPHFSDRTRLVRIWTGDIEIHISADIAYAAMRYWQISKDDEWFITRGAELILDTARFWTARAEFNPAMNRYEYHDVIGPDEYHDHVDNNFYTNRMAKWNIQAGLEVWSWLRTNARSRADELAASLKIDESSLSKWREVAEKIYLPAPVEGVIEQFDGYFARKFIDLAALEPRDISAQVLFGIEGCNETQILKQPDVLMLMYLLGENHSLEILKSNYDFYTPRTDHNYGSSLGPSVQAILACRLGRVEEAFEHFLRAARADLFDIRGNAGDGIHAASAGGIWQAVVFGFAGLQITTQGWSTTPALPNHWKRLSFRFKLGGQVQIVDLIPTK